MSSPRFNRCSRVSRDASCRLVLVCASAVGKNREKMKIMKTQLSSKRTGGSFIHHFVECVQRLLLEKYDWIRSAPSCPRSIKKKGSAVIASRCQLLITVAITWIRSTASRIFQGISTDSSTLRLRVGASTESSLGARNFIQKHIVKKEVVAGNFFSQQGSRRLCTTS